MNYVIQDKFKVKTNHGSKGCQIKYFRNNYWYKLDTSCNEGKNEHIVSLILKCSTIKDFVYYEACTVNNRKACRSYNFLNENEMLITLSDLISTLTGNNNPENVIWQINDIRKRFEFIVNAVKKYTNNSLDITDYLKTILYLDLFILNRDRHLNNLGIIVDVTTNKYRTAPIFDNGLSLLGGCQSDVFENGIEYAINSQNSKTISGSFINQILACSNGKIECPFKINFKKLDRELRNDTNLTALHKIVLKYQYESVGKIYK